MSVCVLCLCVCAVFWCANYVPLQMSCDDYESLPTNNVAIHLTAGAFAGVAEHTAMYPLDCIKVSWMCFLNFPVYMRHEGLLPLSGFSPSGRHTGNCQTAKDVMCGGPNLCRLAL